MGIRSQFLILVIFGTFYFSCRESQPIGQYLNQGQPGTKPEVFAPGLISKDSLYEFGSVFTSDGYEMYYGVDLGHRSEIRSTKYKDGVWSDPQTAIAHDKYGFNDPFLSPDESELYYISNLPRNASDTLGDYDIWFSKRIGDGWSDPINAGGQINSDFDEYYVSFTDDKTMYFSSNRTRKKDSLNNFNIYRSEFRDGRFSQPTALSDSINGRAYEADVYVAPDESYVIFCSRRSGGLGRGDLYISQKRADRSWTKPLNLGEQINSEGHQLCPFVTRDGKYFFYTSDEDIYWVSFPNLFETFTEKLL